MLAAFLSVLIAYLGFMSVVGGAVLARYMLPVVPLVILMMVSTSVAASTLLDMIVGSGGHRLCCGLFSNPPYGFSPEDNLAYRDYVVMHVEAGRFSGDAISRGTRFDRMAGVGRTYPALAWLCQCQCQRWCGFSRPAHRGFFRFRRSTWRPEPANSMTWLWLFRRSTSRAHPLLQNWEFWQRMKERFFGYHRDLLPEDIAQRLGGTIAYHDGTWTGSGSR